MSRSETAAGSRGDGRRAPVGDLEPDRGAPPVDPADPSHPRPASLAAVARRDIRKMRSAPRVPLGRWPTPVEELDAGLDEAVLVKRDDLSGVGRGGAKARKIEHLVGHLLERGYDALVTVAGNVTNLAFDLLPVLDRHGIRATLFIADDPPAAVAGRETIFRDIRRRVTLLGPGRTQAVGAALRAWMAGRTAGRRPFLLLPGASHPSAVAGNARGFLEMATQLEEDGRPLPRAVYVSAATGTTVAGFLLAEHALRRAGCEPVAVTGVQVYPGPIRGQTLALIRWTERALGLEGRVPAGSVRIVRDALHGGFARFPPSLEALSVRAGTELGFALDPIFGGKTWSVLASKAKGHAARPLLFWHCGWTPEWRVLARTVGEGGPGPRATPSVREGTR